jgi:hypothetical protein
VTVGDAPKHTMLTQGVVPAIRSLGLGGAASEPVGVTVLVVGVVARTGVEVVGVAEMVVTQSRHLRQPKGTGSDEHDAGGDHEPPGPAVEGPGENTTTTPARISKGEVVA